MGCLGVMGSQRATVLLTRQPGRGCTSEPQALASTCCRQPPPRLRESSLVSTAACGPGCSRGQRGLVTCCWPFMLCTATQAPGWTCRWCVCVWGGSATCTPQGRVGKVSALRCAGVYADTHTCSQSHTARSHTCIPAHFQTCAHLHTQASDRHHVCSEHGSTQRYRYRQTCV